MTACYTTQDVLERLDQRAASIDFSKSSSDLFELDAAMWLELLRDDKSAALPPTVKAAARSFSSEDLIARLASGSISSFTYECTPAFLSTLRSRIEPGALPYMLTAHSDPAFHLRACFLRTVRHEAARIGVPRASQMFSLTADTVLAILGASTGQLSHAALQLGDPVCRSTPELIITLLECPADAVPAQKLKKIQQGLSSGEAYAMSTLPGMRRIIYSDDADAGKTNAELNRDLLARQMLIQGFISRVITIETGLTYRQLRRIKDAVKAAKYLGSGSRQLRTSTSVIQTNADKLQSSIVMRIYGNLAGVMGEQETCVDSIVNAFALYCAIRHDVFGQREYPNRTIQITDVWGLARELRSNLGRYDYCSDCNLSHFISVNQRATSIKRECPFCRPTVPKGL